MGWPRWSHTMNYSCFGLSLSRSMLFSAISAYTHHSRACPEVCVCVCKCTLCIQCALNNFIYFKDFTLLCMHPSNHVVHLSTRGSYIHMLLIVVMPLYILYLLKCKRYPWDKSSVDMSKRGKVGKQRLTDSYKGSSDRSLHHGT